MGTPLYMAPEQHQGEVADHRSDQFSFCVALYEALYRQLPFAGTTVLQLAANAIKGNVRPPPASSNVPTRVHDALLRGLAKAPDARFLSMRELLAVLAFNPTSDTATAPRALRWVVACVPTFAVLYTVGLHILRRLGISEMVASLLASALLFLFCTLVPLRFRRVVKTNLFHSSVMIIGLASIGQLCLLRIVGILLGLTITQVNVVDLVAFAAGTAMVAALSLPRLWPSCPLLVTLALGAAAHPVYASPIAALTIPAAIIACIIAWYRTAQASAQVRSSKPAPLTQ
jgi:hypothetical protein